MASVLGGGVLPGFAGNESGPFLFVSLIQCGFSIRLDDEQMSCRGIFQLDVETSHQIAVIDATPPPPTGLHIISRTDGRPSFKKFQNKVQQETHHIKIQNLENLPKPARLIPNPHGKQSRRQ